MKVGILGGSFDPVHREHLAIAEAAVKVLGLDKIIIVPAYAPPHKPWKRLAPSEDRVNMCKIAFSGLPQAEISDFEISGGGTSYTYITCEHFKREYPDSVLYFLVGEDMLDDFYSWRYPERILSCVTLAVCARNAEGRDLSLKKDRFFERFGCNFVELGYNGGRISSTDIRVTLAVGDSPKELLPFGVEEYIREKGLYIMPCIPKALALEKSERAEHSKRVAMFAGRLAAKFRIDERSAILAAGIHDAGKNLPSDSPLLKGFEPPEGVPRPVMHQYTGAYVAEHYLGIEDEDVLNAVRYHTSGRAGMSDLEMLIYVSDMLEEGRTYEGVEKLRDFSRGLEYCTFKCLESTIEHLRGASELYPLTLHAYEYYKNKGENK